tara:strand:+ start:340 stop:1092 length:753 start_codon:yes stop_codon:yes gene_type:complete
MAKKWYDLSELKKHQFNYYAQAGEDGLLKYIFENIQPRCKFGVEFGAGGVMAKQNFVPTGLPMNDVADGTNLKLFVNDFNWKTVMWENKPMNSPASMKKYGIHIESVTIENVNDLFKKYNVPENVDVVVIDVDGQDYWIWEALDWKPQVVVIEFNTTIDKNESKVMHKDSEHYKWRDNTSSYYGASVSALKKLGKKKGYTLIDVCGRNLFFILDELVEDGYDVNVNDLGVKLVEADKSREVNKKEKWVNV